MGTKAIRDSPSHNPFHCKRADLLRWLAICLPRRVAPVNHVCEHYHPVIRANLSLLDLRSYDSKDQNYRNDDSEDYHPDGQSDAVGADQHCHRY